MEVATIFIVGHYNEIPRGALLLVSDVPVTPDGVKTEASDKAVTSKWADQHLDIGIQAMTNIGKVAIRLNISVISLFNKFLKIIKDFLRRLLPCSSHPIV